MIGSEKSSMTTSLELIMHEVKKVIKKQMISMLLMVCKSEIFGNIMKCSNWISGMTPIY